jgi:uncharacterized protein (TIGR02594 family)
MRGLRIRVPKTRPGSIFSLAPIAFATLIFTAVGGIAGASAAPRHAATSHFSSSKRHHAWHHRSYHHRYSARVQRHAFGRAAAFGDRADGTMTQQSTGSFGGFGASNVVAEARRYLGTNPTGRASLWCARFMNMVLQRTGRRGTGSDLARSFASYGQRVSGPQVGAIAVMGRRGGGHVGVVSGVDSKGNPIVISGNHGHRVAESVYSRGRIYAYVMPST